MRPPARSVQLVELRRAIVPNSWPSSRGILEFERVIGGAAGFDQVAAGGGDRSAGPLLVAGEDDGDAGALERSGRVHGAERGDDDDEPAFVVADAGAGGAVAGALEALERAVGLEHGVEMADQEDVAAGAAAGSDDMAGAAGLAHVDPSDLEAERLELGAHHLANRSHAREVQRAAVHVHQPLEQGNVAVRLAVDGGGHRPLLAGEARLGGDGESEQSEEGEDSHPGHLRLQAPRVKAEPGPGLMRWGAEGEWR